MIASGKYFRSPPKPRPVSKVLKVPDTSIEDAQRQRGAAALSGNIPDKKDLNRQSGKYHALSDPLRLTILYLLRDQPLGVSIVNRFMRIGGSKLSYHLTVLREAGLIEGEYRGNWIIYSLTDTGRKYLE